MSFHLNPSSLLEVYYRQEKGTIKLNQIILENFGLDIHISKYVWYGNCTVSDRNTLQRIVRKDEKIIGTSLPSSTDTHHTHCIHKATSMVEDATNPSHTPLTHTPNPAAVWHRGTRESGRSLPAWGTVYSPNTHTPSQGWLYAGARGGSAPLNNRSASLS